MYKGKLGYKWINIKNSCLKTLLLSSRTYELNLFNADDFLLLQNMLKTQCNICFAFKANNVSHWCIQNTSNTTWQITSLKALMHSNSTFNSEEWAQTHCNKLWHNPRLHLPRKLDMHSWHKSQGIMLEMLVPFFFKWLFYNVQIVLSIILKLGHFWMKVAHPLCVFTFQRKNVSNLKCKVVVKIKTNITYVNIVDVKVATKSRIIEYHVTRSQAL
jgi:hypothetical protein